MDRCFAVVGLCRTRCEFRDVEAGGPEAPLRPRRGRRTRCEFRDVEAAARVLPVPGRPSSRTRCEFRDVEALGAS